MPHRDERDRPGLHRELEHDRFHGPYARDDYRRGLGGDHARDLHPTRRGQRVTEVPDMIDDGDGQLFEPRRAQVPRDDRTFDGDISYRGLGPRGYRRSDDRILEEVNEALTDDHDIDASHVEVSVRDCEVTLSGTVSSRYEKRRAEDLAERCRGVVDVHNRLRVADQPRHIGKASE